MYITKLTLKRKIVNLISLKVLAPYILDLSLACTLYYSLVLFYFLYIVTYSNIKQTKSQSVLLSHINIHKTFRIGWWIEWIKKKTHVIFNLWIHWRFTKHYIVIVTHRTTGFSTWSFSMRNLISHSPAKQQPFGFGVGLLLFTYVYRFENISIRSDNKTVYMRTNIHIRSDAYWIRDTQHTWDCIL